jgi:sigma-B regulation protein RsbU (phosphoserine phosphatase)
VRIDWRFVPSTQLAGDAFGYRWLDEKNLAIYLLDVSGHGVGSALLAVTALNILNHGSMSQTDFKDPAAVMLGLNGIFQMATHGQKFFTIWYGVYNTETHTMTFSGGGHPPPLLMAMPHAPPARELEADGPPIGITDMLPFVNATVQIAPGQRMLIYSDGAVEIDTPDGNVTNQQEFNDFVNSLGPCEGLMEKIVLRGRQLRQKETLNDDCSLMQIEF